MQNKNVLVVGNSYSSASVFYCLQKYLDKSRLPYDIILISDQKYFLHNGLLPEYLMGQCSLDELTQEFRNVGYMRPGVSLMDSRLLEIDFKGKTLETTKGTLRFDYLVLAPECDEYTSSVHIKNSNVLTVQTPVSILKIKQHIKNVLEQAAHENNIDFKRSLLTFSVLGANKKGVEIVFAIADYIFHLLGTQYYEIKKSFISINLIDEKKELNIGNNSFYSNYLSYGLKKKGIKLLLDVEPIKIEEGKICLGNKKSISSSTIVVANNCNESSLFKSVLWSKKEYKNQISTNVYCALPDNPDVYLIGEAVNSTEDKGFFSNSVTAYHEQAKLCAENIISQINNNPLKPFRLTTEVDYLNLGKRNSSVSFNKIKVSGILGWLAFRLLYAGSFLGNKKKTKMFYSFMSFLFGLRDYDTTEILNENVKNFEKSLLSKK